jgi:hypothetical protein
MQMRTHIPVFLILLTIFSGSSAGPVVYMWVDDSGITCFSDTLPGDDSLTVKLIEDLPQPAAGIPGDEDFYSVVNQAKRMENQRLLNEKLMAERLQAEAEANRARAEALAAQQPTIVYEEGPGYIWPYYPRSHHRHPHRDHKPGGPGKPDHYTRSSILQPPPMSDALRLSPSISDVSNPKIHRVDSH